MGGPLLGGAGHDHGLVAAADGGALGEDVEARGLDIGENAGQVDARASKTAHAATDFINFAWVDTATRTIAIAEGALAIAVVRGVARRQDERQRQLTAAGS